MLSRPLRLRHRLDISRVYKRGRVVGGAALSLRYLPNYGSSSRAVVVVSTKVAKRAVERNRLRRRLYSATRRLWPQAKDGYDFVITVHNGARNLTHQQLLERLTDCLAKSQTLKN